MHSLRTGHPALVSDRADLIVTGINGQAAGEQRMGCRLAWRIDLERLKDTEENRVWFHGQITRGANGAILQCDKATRPLAVQTAAIDPDHILAEGAIEQSQVSTAAIPETAAIITLITILSA